MSLDVGPDRVAGRLDQQLVGLRVAPAERPPAELDRLEAARDGWLQLVAQAGPARRRGCEPYGLMRSR